MSNATGLKPCRSHCRWAHTTLFGSFVDLFTSETWTTARRLKRLSNIFKTAAPSTGSPSSATRSPDTPKVLKWRDYGALEEKRNFIASLSNNFSMKERLIRMSLKDSQACQIISRFIKNIGSIKSNLFLFCETTKLIVEVICKHSDTFKLKSSMNEARNLIGPIGSLHDR